MPLLKVMAKLGNLGIHSWLILNSCLKVVNERISHVLLSFIKSPKVCHFSRCFCGQRTPKTNMEPEKNSLEKEKHLQATNFWVPC